RKLPQRRHRRLVGPFDPHRPLEAVDLDPGRKLRLDNQRLFTRRVRRKGAGIARHAPQNARFSTSRETETAVSRMNPSSAPPRQRQHGDYDPSELMLARPMQWIHFVAL